MSMSKLDDHLEDPYYVFWVEAGTCLGFLKTFLESLADNLSVSLHKSVLKNILVCRQKQSIPAYMNMCRHSVISFKRSLTQWTINCCANCQSYINQLVKCCDPPFKLKQCNWNNSDIQMWPTDPWEKAKVYMNPGQKRCHRCPSDTDMSGLVNFLDNCTVSGTWWRPSPTFKQKLAKVRDCRNALMHSATLQISSQQKQDYIATMLDLVQDYLAHPNLRQQAQNTVHLLKEVQRSNFVITTDAEFKVLKDRAASLRQQNKDMRTGMEELQKQCHELIGKKDKNSQKKLKALLIHIEENSTALETFDETFSSLKTLATSNQELTEKMKLHIIKTSTSLNKTRAKLTEARKDKRAITKQDANVIEETIPQYQAKQEQIEILRNQVEQLTKEKQKLAKDLEMMKRENVTYKTEIAHQHHKQKVLEQEMQEIKTLNENLMEQVEKLQEDRDRIKSECGSLKLEVNNVCSELVCINTHQDDLRSVSIENNELKWRCQNLEDELKEMNKDYQNNTNELKEVNAKNQEIMLQLNLLLGELGELKSAKASAEAELRKQSIANHKLICRNKKHEKELSKLKDESDNILCQLKTVSVENGALKAYLSNCQDCENIKENMTDTIREIEALCDINNQIELEKEILLKQLSSVQDERNSIVKTVFVKNETLKALKQLNFIRK